MNSCLRKQSINLSVGDPVEWVDPDNAECSGRYRVQEILTETGWVEDMDSVLVISNDAGGSAEVYAREIV